MGRHQAPALIPVYPGRRINGFTSRGLQYQQGLSTRRRLLRVAVPAAAVVAAATVLWTVRYPEHAGQVFVPASDVPPLAWLAAGATVVAAVWLLAKASSDTALQPRQGLTLVRFSAQRKHFSCPTRVRFSD